MPENILHIILKWHAGTKGNGILQSKTLGLNLVFFSSVKEIDDINEVP